MKIYLFKHRVELNRSRLELIEEKYIVADFSTLEGKKKKKKKLSTLSLITVLERYILDRLVVLHFRDLATTHPGILLLFPLGPRGGFHIVTIH